MVDGGEQIKRTGERLAHVDDGPHGIGADLSRRGRWRVARADGNRVRDLPILRTELQHDLAAEVPERNPLYRMAKRLFFNDFGVYAGRDHARVTGA